MGKCDWENSLQVATFNRHLSDNTMSLSVQRQIAHIVKDVLEVRDAAWDVQVISKCTKAAERYGVALNESVTSRITTHSSLESLPQIRNADVLVLNKVLASTIENADELDAFLRNVLIATKFGGAVVIHEDLENNKDSKQVARLTDYFDVFRHTIDGKNAGLELYTVDQVENSIYVKQNYLDFFWVFTKKEFEASSESTLTFRDFLDKTQYTNTGIYAYEWIFGDNFISPGGYDENLRIIKRFGDLREGQTMLDIGVGIGGGARQVADEFGVSVKGIDLSSNMLAVGLERIQQEKDARVRYSITDALVYKFPTNSFDYVFSRDCIQHIPDTVLLFKRIYDCLKPGGKVLITMYGCGYGVQSEKFKSYVAQRHYFLKNLKQIEQIANEIGFTKIYTENMTPRFKEILGEERSRVENNMEEFLSKFSENEYKSLVNGWTDKLGYIADDNHNWNLFLAEKPL